MLSRPNHPNHVMILDHVRSMHNVGAAFRISDAFLLPHLYLCGITATPPHRMIHKTALGAESTVPWTHHVETTILIQHLKSVGYDLVAVEQTPTAIPLAKFHVKKNHQYAFVFGHEITGVSTDVLQQCDHAVVLPRFGQKQSLNVSVCMGMVVWEFYRQQN